RPRIAGRLVERRAAVLLALDRTLHPRHRGCLLRALRLARAAFSLPTQQSLDVPAVAARDLGAAAETTRPPAGLLLEQGRPKRLPAPDLARPRHLVTLGGAPMRLHLRHHCSPSLPFPLDGAARARAGRLVGFNTMVMLRPS